MSVSLGYRTEDGTFIVTKALYDDGTPTVITMPKREQAECRRKPGTCVLIQFPKSERQRRRLLRRNTKV